VTRGFKWQDTAQRHRSRFQVCCVRSRRLGNQHADANAFCNEAMQRACSVEKCFWGMQSTLNLVRDAPLPSVTMLAAAARESLSFLQPEARSLQPDSQSLFFGAMIASAGKAGSMKPSAPSPAATWCGVAGFAFPVAHDQFFPGSSSALS